MSESDNQTSVVDNPDEDPKGLVFFLGVVLMGLALGLMMHNPHTPMKVWSGCGSGIVGLLVVCWSLR